MPRKNEVVRRMGGGRAGGTKGKTESPEMSRQWARRRPSGKKDG